MAYLMAKQNVDAFSNDRILTHEIGHCVQKGKQNEFHTAPLPFESC